MRERSSTVRLQARSDSRALRGESADADTVFLDAAASAPKPRVVIDGAHNAASIQALIRALGAHIAYDSLVFATGSRAFVPPIARADAPGCFVYRTLDDVYAIESYAKRAGRGVVIGGGLLYANPAAPGTRLPAAGAKLRFRRPRRPSRTSSSARSRAARTGSAAWRSRSDVKRTLPAEEERDVPEAPGAPHRETHERIRLSSGSRPILSITR